MLLTTASGIDFVDSVGIGIKVYSTSADQTCCTKYPCCMSILRSCFECADSKFILKVVFLTGASVVQVLCRCSNAGGLKPKQN